MISRPQPAPLPRRVLAGLVDAAALGLLWAVGFFLPLVLRGFVLPMWGVLAAVVGWAIVPLAFFGQTLGLRLFGLRLLREDGHHVDLATVIFRELVGRGAFPVGYLFTVAASALAARWGLGGAVGPAGLGSALTALSLLAALAAGLGHLLALRRADQRTAADLLAGSVVVQGPARALPDDPEERAERLAHRALIRRRVVAFELLLAASVLAVPWLLTARARETTRERLARLQREALERRFRADPANVTTFEALQGAYARSAQEEEAAAALAAHQAALRTKEQAHEAQLRAALAAGPSRATATALVELLERQGRVDDAEAVYRAWLGATPTPSARAGFGSWLASHGRTASAVAELERALAEEPLVPFGHTLLGVSLQRAGRLLEAREHLELALLDDPDDEDAADALAAVEAAVGRLPGEARLALTRRLDGWRRDAGP